MPQMNVLTLPSKRRNPLANYYDTVGGLAAEARGLRADQQKTRTKIEADKQRDMVRIAANREFAERDRQFAAEQDRKMMQNANAQMGFEQRAKFIQNSIALDKQPQAHSYNAQIFSMQTGRALPEIINQALPKILGGDIVSDPTGKVQNRQKMAVDRTKEAISQSTAGGRMSAEEVAGMLYQLGADHPLIDTTKEDAFKEWQRKEDYKDQIADQNRVVADKEAEFQEWKRREDYKNESVPTYSGFDKDVVDQARERLLDLQEDRLIAEKEGKDTSSIDNSIAFEQNKVNAAAQKYSRIMKPRNPLASAGETEPNDPMQAKNTGGKQLTDQVADEYMRKANGNKNLALQMARQDGYVW